MDVLNSFLTSPDSRVIGGAIVAGLMIFLVLVRKGLLVLLGDRRDFKIHGYYQEIIQQLRDEVGHLRATLSVERTWCEEQIKQLKTQMTDLERVVKLRKNPR